MECDPFLSTRIISCTMTSNITEISIWKASIEEIESCMTSMNDKSLDISISIYPIVVTGAKREVGEYLLICGMRVIIECAMTNLT